MNVSVQRGSPTTGTNRLIAALPPPVRRRLLACGENVVLQVADVLCETGQRIRHVFFPTGALISLTTPIPGHPNLAVSLVGDEGMVGIWPALGINVAPLHAAVQGQGSAWRLDVVAFCREVEQSLALRRVLNGYLYVILAERSQTTACACFHLLEGRLARWFLMTRDRAHSDEFHITHERLADILGVRRAGITRAAISLQARRLIRYSRGDISIVDVSGLETAACDCYAADRKTYTSVFG